MSTSEISLSARPVVPADFPTWLPAMLVKELRQGLRARGFVAAFIAFQMILVVIFAWAFFMAEINSEDSFRGLDGFFWALLSISLLLVTPLRGMGALRDEMDAKSIDLLLLTHLRCWQIVLGKWTSLMAQALLLLISVLPYAMVRYFFGEINLVEDLKDIFSMFCGSAVLTAVALWFSSMPKILRIILPIFLVIALQGGFVVALSWQAISRPAHPTATSSFYALAGNPSLFLWIYNGLVVLVFFLIQAVRRLAPPAENHAFTVRILSLAVLLPIPPLYWLNRIADERWQGLLAFIILLVIAVTETAFPTSLMRIHWLSWATAKGLRRVMIRFLLPGWPSACAFAGVALALLLGVALAGKLQHGTNWLEGITLFALAWEALVIPAIILSAFSRLPTWIRGVLFLVVQLVALIFASIGTREPTEEALREFTVFFNHVCQFIPPVNFWQTLIEADQTPLAVSVEATHLVVFVVVLALYFIFTRKYWRNLKKWETSPRANAPVSGASTA